MGKSGRYGNLRGPTTPVRWEVTCTDSTTLARLVQEKPQGKTQGFAQEMLPRGGPKHGSNSSTFALVAASYDFPHDLIDAQDELRQVRAELQTLYQRVPWSAEPLGA